MIRSTILHNARLFLKFRGQQETVKDEEVHSAFREPWIRSGYRKPYRPWSYYFASVFHVHNETLNIWTHLIGSIFMCYELYAHVRMYDFWTDGPTRPMFVYLLSCVCVNLFSTLAHILHSKSEHAHYTCFQADYAGIGMFCYGSGLVTFYYGCFDEGLYTAFLSIFLPFNTFMAWLTCFFFSVAKLKFEVSRPSLRKCMQVGSVGLHVSSYLLISRVPRYIDCFIDSACAFPSLWLHVLNWVAMFTSPLFFIGHLPEKTWPGRFDIVGHGHQVFHVANFVIEYVVLKIARDDIGIQARLSWQREFPCAWELIISFGLIALADTFTIVILSKYVRRRIVEKKS